VSPNPHYSGAVIEAQPDWLTVSAHGETPAKALLDLAVGLEKEERALGGKPRKWRSMGYEGLHTGRIEYGQRDRFATELRLSGNAANTYLAPAVALADRITRLDLAVTWRGDEPAPKLGLQELARVKRYHEAHPKSAGPWIVSDVDGGFTLYVGQRLSEYFGRLYNKEAQERKQMGKTYDHRYDNAWRYELEMKASVPTAVLKKMQKADDQAAWVQAYVHTYFAAHGMSPPFEAAGPMQLVPGFRRASDADSKLNHLSKNVRPTVLWLKEQGRGDDLMKALGLA